MNIEEKKTEIEAFLQVKGMARRQKLEQAITGKVELRYLVAPAVLTIAALGILIMTWGARSSESFALLMPLFYILFAMSGWIWAHSAATNRRIKALKEYVDFRLAEKDDDLNSPTHRPE